MLGIDLYDSTHLQTLVELKKICNERGYRISIHFRSVQVGEADAYDEFELTDEQKEYLDINDILIECGGGSYSYIQFELHNKNKEVGIFQYRIDDYYVQFTKELDSELFEEIKHGYLSDWGDNSIITIEREYSILQGWEGLDLKSKEKNYYGCYREGMTMHWFAMLVCDYLKVDRIIRNY